MRLYVMGGRSCLVRNFERYDPERVTINSDIHAMAKGYETLATNKLHSGRSGVVGATSSASEPSPGFDPEYAEDLSAAMEFIDSF